MHAACNGIRAAAGPLALPGPISNGILVTVTLPPISCNRRQSTAGTCGHQQPPAACPPTPCGNSPQCRTGGGRRQVALSFPPSFAVRQPSVPPARGGGVCNLRGRQKRMLAAPGRKPSRVVLCHRNDELLCARAQTRLDCGRKQCAATNSSVPHPMLETCWMCLAGRIRRPATLWRLF